MSTRKIIIIAAIAFIILILGIEGYRFSKFLSMGKMPPTVVETYKTKASVIQEKITATGTLTAYPGIVVRPEISGRITKVYFNSGDFVAAGSPLIEINPDIMKAQLEQDKAALQLAKVDYDRAKALYVTKAISKSDLDKSQSTFLQNQAAVVAEKARLQQATIVAPFSGKLGITLVNLGDFVNAGQDIVNLQTLDPINIDFSIPETYLSKISLGQTVLLHSDAYPNETFTGKIAAIESLIDQTNRTLKVRASAPNKDGKLVPGSFVEVFVLLKESNVIMVPQTAIVYAPDGNVVYRLINHKAVKTPVTIGTRDADNIVILSGLKPDETIITAGQMKLFDGSEVLTQAEYQGFLAKKAAEKAKGKSKDKKVLPEKK
ncbi:MAG: efflux RND transporter periplasmic adaptor subunit [Gammaproteobacteria bacterium]|nr:efflux RND transporter periplasmic adaptor subunit [Gammaproteobacteria bacterium]